jgi:NAD(P)-dependent dehydrogenase (short-subunit alcohol dehydrogenase family)
MSSSGPAGVAVVGGGTGVLGSAVVERLHASGWQVVVPAREPGRARVPAGVILVEADLDDAAAVERLAVEVGAVGRWAVLVNASGGYAGGAAHELDDEQIAQQLSLNLLGPWRLARAAARSMIAAGEGGRIVNVASRASVTVARGQAAYQVSKAGLLRLTEVMAAELRKHRITVNAVLPQTIDTPTNRAAMPEADVTKWLSPAEVAAVIEWLLSPAAAVVTGSAIPVFER